MIPPSPKGSTETGILLTWSNVEDSSVRGSEVAVAKSGAYGTEHGLGFAFCTLNEIIRRLQWRLWKSNQRIFNNSTFLLLRLFRICSGETVQKYYRVCTVQHTRRCSGTWV